MRALSALKWPSRVGSGHACAAVQRVCVWKSADSVSRQVGAWRCVRACRHGIASMHAPPPRDLLRMGLCRARRHCSVHSSGRGNLQDTAQPVWAAQQPPGLRVHGVLPAFPGGPGRARLGQEGCRPDPCRPERRRVQQLRLRHRQSLSVRAVCFRSDVRTVRASARPYDTSGQPNVCHLLLTPPQLLLFRAWAACCSCSGMLCTRP
jgi:hypothetical protein